MDICAPTVLNVICSSENRKHTSLLQLTANLFTKVDGEPPNRIIHFITFIFLLKNPSLIPKALDLCAKLNEARREIIMPYVQISFDNALTSFDPNQPSQEITEFLKRFPAIASTRQPQMLSLLDELLQSTIQKPTFEVIGALFNALAPKRNLSQSIRLTDSHSIELDNTQVKQQIKGIPPSISSQAPDFWEIYIKNQDKINDIIEKDPKKMKTVFKFLLEYPELTPFKTRVAVFHDAMKDKILPGQLRITVRRDSILTDSFRRLGNTPVNELLKHINVSFVGENGFDAGGLRRDWFTSLIKEILNANYALFLPSSNGRSYQPNPASYVNTEHIQYFKFAGKILARALIDNVNVDAHLTTSFCKHILQTPVSLRDLEDVDETLHRSLKWMLDNDVTPLEMQFTTDYDEYGVHSTIDLKPNGSEIMVTNENKEEFVNLMVEHRLKKQISCQIKAFCDGFYALIPLEEIRRFSPNELDLLICGVPEIDVEDLKQNCEYAYPYSADHPVIKYFFNVISKWSNENLAKLLLFVTGSSQVPINGFKFFKDMEQPITIAPGGGKERLPAAHTCFNTIDLPEYENENELSEKLLFAIQECNSFGFI
ncbi:ubiquitin-protein ligase 1 [Histomonas meleagridis]|uniref:ubiquitin-protein ligase 1 n=1 Tax=Histomonas meleagridis TaxID=135588 RepID=UPI0035598C08|nr:ubiquitin-protein ligase 1 [Histomonas meleagridis]KAH0798591.1 ubiquitin-protein ligase 1 [Histomonas meleagridis]